MKIAKIETLHADAGQRNFDFLKITTDDGLVGWSEYNESFKEMQLPPLETLDDVVALGKEVVARGDTALKTNVIVFGGTRPYQHSPASDAISIGSAFPS